MSHGLLGEAKFYALLVRFDVELCASARLGGCWSCGGRLDRADFPRKPRGGPSDLDAAYGKRLGLCCDVCRVRTLPQSVRFMGRRVYLAAIVVLVSAMRHGATPSRVAELDALFGISTRTLVRWRRWWTETFPTTPFWKAARGRFSGDVDLVQMPKSLIERFGADEDADAMTRVLQFLSPITTASRVPRARIPMGL